MKLITAQEMQALDKKAIEEYGIPSLLLMENAGRGVAEFIFNIKKNGRATIFCGKGNNGGDGLVIARHLHNRGFSVLVLMFAEPSELKPDPKVNLEIVQKMQIHTILIDSQTKKEDLIGFASKSDVVVDALFGVGLSKPIEGLYKTAIEAINEGAKQIVAVDIPSGLHADTGEVLGVAVKATHTGTLGLPKKGLLEGQGREHSGKVCVVNIGLPKQEIDKVIA